MNVSYRLYITVLFLVFSSFVILRKTGKPTLFIIGDSTARNGSGKGDKNLWGWGDFMYEQLDTTKIHIENRARGGRSSRTYLTEGLWSNVLSEIKPGDVVFIQFGHNDDSPLNTGRARGSLHGIGGETEEVVMDTLTGRKEVVHTYGWYIRTYIREAKAKGAIPIVFSLTPRNIWKDARVVRASNDYGKWAQQIASQENAAFIDLNELIARKYDVLGLERLKAELFIEDHTHTNKTGAQLNARTVVEGLSQLKKNPLKGYVLPVAKSTGL